VVATPAAELKRLLRGDARAVERQEAEAWLKLARERSGDIVLFGAGGLGRKIAAGLRANGVEPLAFADNSPARQGTSVDGIPVLSPGEAAREFGDYAIFVVSIWGANSTHRFAHSRDQLAELGCAVMAFPPLCWKFAGTLLPHYLQDLPHKVLDEKDDVQRAFDLWEDDASRVEYVSQVRFRLTADFDGLAHPVKHPQYFPDDLYAWRGDEWIVDGGAYDGDSIRVLSQLHGDAFGHVLALEPDPANFLKLEATVAALPPAARSKIECRQVALASVPGTLHLDAMGTASSVTSATARAGTIAVPAEPLDALLGGAVPTFIKLDIEGAEPDALMGARETIRAHAPVIAVCVYHLQNHLWTIPLMLRAWRDDYAFFLRPHNEEGWDLVCYAVPRARLTWRGQ
jgi:FkbM family methyltransferase